MPLFCRRKNNMIWNTSRGGVAHTEKRQTKTTKKPVNKTLWRQCARCCNCEQLTWDMSAVTANDFGHFYAKSNKMHISHSVWVVCRPIHTQLVMVDLIAGTQELIYRCLRCFSHPVCFAGHSAGMRWTDEQILAHFKGFIWRAIKQCLRNSLCLRGNMFCRSRKRTLVCFN